MAFKKTGKTESLGSYEQEPKQSVNNTKQSQDNSKQVKPEQSEDNKWASQK